MLRNNIQQKNNDQKYIFLGKYYRLTKKAGNYCAIELNC